MTENKKRWLGAGFATAAIAGIPYGVGFLQEMFAPEAVTPGVLRGLHRECQAQHGLSRWPGCAFVAGIEAARK